MDYRRPLGLSCLFVLVVQSLHHYTQVPWINVERQLFIEWVMPEHMFTELALCAVGTLVMFFGISVLTSIILFVVYVAVPVDNGFGVNLLTVSCPAAVRLSR